MSGVIQDSWLPVGVAVIEAFEKRIQMSLPEDFRTFLQKTNGGKTADRCQFREGSIQQFYGLGIGFAYADLDWKFDTFVREERMPENCVPFASDEGGNQYVLVCQGKRRGQVWFWDHESGLDDGEASDAWWDIMYLQAKSFAAFASALTLEVEAPVSSDKSFRAIESGSLVNLKDLMDHGLKIDHRTTEDYFCRETMLAHAVRFGRLDIIQHLVANGADMALADSNGEPAIFQTCIGHESSDALNLLLDAGVSANVRSAGGVPLIVHAARVDSARIMTWLLQRQGIDVTSTAGDNQTALDIAEQAGRIEMVRLLKSRGKR